MVGSNGFRIDPAHNGIHIVDVANGGERVYIHKNKIDKLIDDLRKVDR